VKIIPMQASSGDTTLCRHHRLKITENMQTVHWLIMQQIM